MFFQETDIFFASSRINDTISFFIFFDHQRNHMRRMLSISIQRDNYLSFRRFHSRCQSCLMSEIPRETNSPYSFLLFTEFVDILPSIITRSIIDKNYLPFILLENIQNTEKFLIDKNNIFSLGKCGNHDGKKLFYRHRLQNNIVTEKLIGHLSRATKILQTLET